jgi:hypothetical protein
MQLDWEHFCQWRLFDAQTRLSRLTNPILFRLIPAFPYRLFVSLPTSQVENASSILVARSEN